jgi:hypothetical protein
MGGRLLDVVGPVDPDHDVPAEAARADRERAAET